MRIQTLLPATILVLATALYTAHGQGCSDAGFCTMHGIGTDVEDTTAHKDNYIKAGVSNGRADHDITVWNIYAEYGRHLGGQFDISAKLSYQIVDGSLAQTSGVADIYTGISYAAFQHALLTIGLKLPLHDGNTMHNSQPLPMDYQPGLGTTDLIAGIAYEFSGIQLAAAIQQPLTQNRNSFLATTGSGFEQFYSTNEYKRKGDVLIRASYAIGVAGKLTITPGLLAIYHLANDTFTDAGGTRRTIDGSQGVTLNGTLLAHYAISPSDGLSLSVGTPFVTRTARPDGLTRGYVAALEYRLAF